MKRKPSSLIIKLLLFFLALLIAASTLIYTNHLVNKLQEREKKLVELYASHIEYLVNSEEIPDYSFQLEIVQQIDFPLILTDAEGNPSSGYRNIDIDSNWTDEQINNFLLDKIDEYKIVHKPIPVYSDSILLQTLYYGDSKMVEELKYYPYFQIMFAILFILISYISFSYIKKSEQSSIWVGMARETAHQLGTPISSLMGWSEILKMNYKDPEKVIDSAKEIDNDLIRLRKIADRFSKIGSKPELKLERVVDCIIKVVNYFKRRLPNFGKNVEIKVTGDSNIKALLNNELFEWVIENLVKNSLDAIESKMGLIEISIAENKNKVEIEVTDNGKGIDFKRRKDIFRPGYSTKRRGWGLGLSLTKRIIEGYHSGKIFVKSSTINVGTTMKIVLKK